MAKNKGERANSPTKRVTKDQWLQCALEVLQVEGIDGVKIERLARQLGIAKAGFYWHFSNRDELLSEMLNYWTEEFTAVVIRASAIRAPSPRQRLLKTMQMIDHHQLNKYELSIRSWAAIDPDAARAVRKVNNLRTKFVGSIFEDLGFRGTELKMRTRMFVVYYSLSPLMFPIRAKSKHEELMKKQLDWFCKK